MLLKLFLVMQVMYLVFKLCQLVNIYPILSKLVNLCRYCILGGSLGNCLNYRDRAYDSFYTSASQQLQLQIASILQNCTAITHKFLMFIGSIYGSADHGVFAIAYGTALSLGKNPETYGFNQIRMQ